MNNTFAVWGTAVLIILATVLVAERNRTNKLEVEVARIEVRVDLMKEHCCSELTSVCNDVKNDEYWDYQNDENQNDEYLNENSNDKTMEEVCTLCHVEQHTPPGFSFVRPASASD